jgi:hypothetical protein
MQGGDFQTKVDFLGVEFDCNFVCYDRYYEALITEELAMRCYQAALTFMLRNKYDDVSSVAVESKCFGCYGISYKASLTVTFQFMNGEIFEKDFYTIVVKVNDFPDAKTSICVSKSFYKYFIKE